jgi:ATP-dependent DNA helicase RecQ
MGHVVEVLTGADTDKIRKWRHHEISTYGIGKDQNRQEWSALGRELIRMGYVRQVPERFNILEITTEGREALSLRKKITVVRPHRRPPERSRKPADDSAYDTGLFEQLRQLRKRLADERAVPPYIVFSDVSLRQMARAYPANAVEFGRISGVGERKLAEFGEIFLAEIAEFLKTHPETRNHS